MADEPETPSFEDAVTAGMNAVADGISRSIDIAFGDELTALFRRITARLWGRPEAQATGE